MRWHPPCTDKAHHPKDKYTTKRVFDRKLRKWYILFWIYSTLLIYNTFFGYQSWRPQVLNTFQQTVWVSSIITSSQFIKESLSMSTIFNLILTCTWKYLHFLSLANKMRHIYILDINWNKLILHLIIRMAWGTKHGNVVNKNHCRVIFLIHGVSWIMLWYFMRKVLHL